jgi:hypothetical protein
MKNATPEDFAPGLMHADPGGYHVRDIEFVTFDVDREEFISRYGRGSAEPTEQRTAAAQD